MVSSIGKKECLLSNILASAFGEQNNKKGKPKKSASFVIVQFFRVNLQGNMFEECWVSFRQTNLRDRIFV